MAAKSSKGKPAKRKKKRTPRTAALELQIEKRRSRVAELRIAGWPIRDIAKQLSVSVGLVHSDLTAIFERTVDRTNEAVNLDRAVSVARIEAATKALWTDIKTGDVDAVNAFAKLDARRAKLLGLDAPTKLEASGPGGGPIPVEAKSSLESKLDQLSQRLASGAAEPGGAAGQGSGASA